MTAPAEPAAAPEGSSVQPPPLSVSVAMGAYNGARFLEPQLASLAAQTRLPLELVVCDDGSTDDTVAVLERFAATAPFDVRVVRNETNLGFGANFMKAARLCRGELIAWCDQDDVWAPEKLARCGAAFEADPDAVLVVHSLQIGEESTGGGASVRGPLSRYRSRRREERILRRRPRHDALSAPIEINARGNCCVVSRRLLEAGDRLMAFVPGSFEQFSGHDTWTSFLAPAIGPIVLLPDVLLLYRLHERQVSGGGVKPATPVARVRRSVSSADATVLDRIEVLATRAFFRAAVLRQLAAQLERDAGLDRSAADFRSAVVKRFADLERPGMPPDAVSFAGAATCRAAMWQRHGEILGRRWQLWRLRPLSPAAVACLVRHAARGDYGRADRGALGWKLLARDLWRVGHPGGGA